MKRAERLHALSEALRRSGARGCAAGRLAEDFGVSVRTIKRDLAALERSGTPIWSRPGPGGGYGLVAGATLAPVTLTPAQAMALLAAVAASRDTPYADLATAGVRTILDVLDPATRARAEALAHRIWVDTGPSTSRATRSALEQAMTDQRVVRIRYTARDGRCTERDVEPILFASAHGTWHLIGWCRLRSAVRWFTLSRIDAAHVTRAPCEGHTLDEVGPPPPTASPAHGTA